jgi:hypothetical protein
MQPLASSRPATLLVALLVALLVGQGCATTKDAPRVDGEAKEEVREPELDARVETPRAPVLRKAEVVDAPPPRVDPRVDQSAVLSMLHFRVFIDEQGGRVLVWTGDGLVALDPVSGRESWSDAAAAGSVWSAGPWLVVERKRDVEGARLDLMDARSLERAATCDLGIDAPETAGALELDVFGRDGHVYALWHTVPPPSPPRGARMSEAQMNEWGRRFAEAYRCGVMDISVAGGRCELTPSSSEDLGAATCDALEPGFPPMASSTLGDVVLVVERRVVSGSVARRVLESELVAKDRRTERELWRRHLFREVHQAPPP